MVRFDKPCKSVSAAVKYFRTHMAKKDYLSQGGQVELTWVGEGAKQLGLSGDVRETEFARLCAGKHPVTNEKLAARGNGPVKRVCYFGQVAPPKDVSIAYLVGGDERIAGWWKEAVNDTVKEIEAITATRVRKGGIDDEDRFTGANRANLKEHKLFNGNIVEVAGVREDGAIVLKDKRTIPPQFRQFSHGYATTSHAAQGKTINRGIVLMAGEGMKPANLRQAYVSHSRFEESPVAYPTDSRAAMDAMATPAERALAIEVVNERIRRWKICQKLTEQAEAWAERRKLAMAARQGQHNKFNQGTYVSQTQKISNSI